MCTWPGGRRGDGPPPPRWRAGGRERLAVREGGVREATITEMVTRRTVPANHVSREGGLLGRGLGGSRLGHSKWEA
jgi:hypothetical protein